MGELHGTDRLSAYIDGELDGREQRAVEAHVAGCDECAAVLAELRRVVLSAADLPPLPPERDLWPGIRTRLSPRGLSAAVPGAASPVISLASRRRVILSVPELLAAGIVVALLTAGIMWAALGASDPAAVSTAGGSGSGSDAWSVSDAVLAAYEPAMTDLEAEYEERRAALDPETIRVVERNLAIIDAAIAEAREALAADPSSGFLSTHLADTMRRRMTLLRQVTSL